MSTESEQGPNLKLSPEEARMIMKAIEDIEREEAIQQERLRSQQASPPTR